MVEKKPNKAKVFFYRISNLGSYSKNQEKLPGKVPEQNEELPPREVDRYQVG